MRLENGPRLQDDFGRRLAYAYTADGLSIDALMIGEGLAEAWTRDGQHRDTLVALEESAREVKDVGLRMRRGDQTLGVVRTQKMLNSVPFPLLRPVLNLLRFLVIDLGLNLSPLGIAQDPFGSMLVTEIGSYGLGVGFPALLPLSGASCVIAIGEISQRAVVRDGEVVARPILPLSATFDHRVADAYHAGALVRAARRFLEHPELLEASPPSS